MEAGRRSVPAHGALTIKTSDDRRLSPLPRRPERRLRLVEAIGCAAVRAVRWRPDAVIRPRALLRPLGRGRLARVAQCTLTLPVAGFKAQGRLSQLGATKQCGGLFDALCVPLHPACRVIASSWRLSAGAWHSSDTGYPGCLPLISVTALLVPRFAPK